MLGGQGRREIPWVTHFAFTRSGIAPRRVAAFNARDIEAALLLMTPDVTWPRAFKGGFVRGPVEAGAYWREQWNEIDPTVEPLAFYREEDGRILVEVHQVVRDLAGAVIADDRVGHRFVIEHGLIRGMEVGEL